MRTDEAYDNMFLMHRVNGFPTQLKKLTESVRELLEMALEA